MRNILALFLITTFSLLSCSKSENEDNVENSDIYRLWDLEYTTYYNSKGESSVSVDDEKTKYKFSKDEVVVSGERIDTGVFGDREVSKIIFSNTFSFWISSDSKKVTIANNYRNVPYDVITLTPSKLVLKSTIEPILELHFNAGK